jgi:ABC-2 type transport system permease protein
MRRISVILFKEWKESLRNKMILFGAIFLPLLMVGAAVAMVYQGRTSGPPGAEVALFNTALMYFLILPVIIPLAIAVYSIVGEKEQGTLEPLLATPISDWELFVGKALVSVLPAVVLTWGSFALFLGVSVALLGRIPPHALTAPWLAAVFGLTPLLSLFSVGVTMLVSSRATDARAAYEFSSLAVLPALVPLIIYSTRKTIVSLGLVAVEGVVLLVGSAVVLYFAIRMFRREQILTRWK